MSWTLFWILYAAGSVVSTTFWVHELGSTLAKTPEAYEDRIKQNLWWSWPVSVILWPVVWAFRLFYRKLGTDDR